MPAVEHDLLDTIEVKEPCPVPWGDMAGDDRVRFCKGCRLNVYNVEGLTRAEALTLLREKEGRLCMRFYRREDGRVVTADCVEVRWARTRKLAALGLAAGMMLLSGIAAALPGLRSSSKQGKGDAWRDVKAMNHKLVDAVSPKPPPIVLSGVVFCPTKK